jgi:hypothetical protein
MRLTFLALILFVSINFMYAQQQPGLTAEEIMARVATNQDKTESERAHYVYLQHARIASRRGKTIKCEEITDSRVIPTSSGSQLQLLKLEGRLLEKGHYIAYNKLESPSDNDHTASKPDNEQNLRAKIDEDPMDRDLVENMRSNLTEAKSKDGISSNLFPLTSKEQAGYTFLLLGRALMNGRDCFHIAFSPSDPDELTWKGDAYIDAAALQPVVIRTAMSRKIPLAVRMLLGTNVPGLGFTIVYAPQPDGLWFPVTFGTEFKLHVLFFLNRQITFSAENHEFEKTHVTSEIHPSNRDITTLTHP